MTGIEHAVIRRLAISFATVTVPAIFLFGCGSTPQPPSALPQPQPRPAATSKAPSAAVPALPPAGSGRGAYYKDDGPGENPPAGLLEMDDAEPKVEPYSRWGNRPYVVFGKAYAPFTDARPFKQRGIGSWYGKKFHGQKTSSGELYDMYKMTAAHPTLPIPSYARVTNLDNGKQVIVRVNDRGPFHAGRIIDLSYVAALKLGYLVSGSGRLEVERLLPGDIARIAAARRAPGNAEAVAVPELSPVKNEQPATTERAAMAEAAAPSPSPLALAGEAPSAAAPSPADQARLFLQVGAYTGAARAKEARDRLLAGRQGMPAIEVIEEGGVFKLLAGPFASPTEAAGATRQLHQAGVAKPLIVNR